jgi:hypothetical protein
MEAFFSIRNSPPGKSITSIDGRLKVTKTYSLMLGYNEGEV